MTHPITQVRYQLMPLISECLGYEHLLTMKLPQLPHHP